MVQENNKVWVGVDGQGMIVIRSVDDKHNMLIRESIGDMVINGLTVHMVDGPVEIGSLFMGQRYKNPPAKNQGKLHDLKTWPQFFEEVSLGRKPFEYRRNDRDFAVNDMLLLREWRPEFNLYTGRVLLFVVISVLTEDDGVGIPHGYVLMGTELERSWHKEDRVY